ncbi:MAG TPA: right-handed parallel beta-helix repeat-containing protein [Amycolatopsis sp.]|nr:right-handed parallel beta-helix repeat-containing protein [Amycolatopsis sp.]HVV14404.1 right-handed parallel beta-helix repeat-containing protein [Amycolatopsis sp.]
MLLLTGLVLAAPAVYAAPGPVCDHQPATYPSAPSGAVTIAPGTDLSAVTRENPPGTAFWLSPGRHVLRADQYSQISPKEGDSFLGAPGALLDGRGVNLFAFTGQARDVSIRNLTVRGFVPPQDQGVVNHDSGDGWVIENSTIEHNGGAGLMAGARQQVRHDCLRDNGQYGMNAYADGDDIAGLVVEGNEIAGNNTDDWEHKSPGCGCSGGVKFWAVNGADVRGNWVHGNHGPGLWADTNNNDFLIENNLIEDNDGEAVFYEISYNLVLSGNTIRRNNIVAGKARGDDFPVAAVYVSESGGEPRVPARTSSIDIHGNHFEDNWSAITLWENADRFCNSPANTSSGYCTLLVPHKADCAQPGIASEPLYGDCRWKTQHVQISENTFEVSPSLCGNGLCSRMAILSNYGTYPDWSPYQGTRVQDAIVTQDNHWHDNTYGGSWTFVRGDPSHVLSPAAWQATSQDTCTSFNGGPTGC